MTTEEKIKYIRSRVSNLLNDNETSMRELDELKNNIAGLCEHFGAQGIVDLGVKLLRLERERAELLEALKEIMPFTATAAIGCHGEKCREPWCHSCNGEEEAEAAAQKGCDAWAKARAAIAHAIEQCRDVDGRQHAENDG